MMTTDETIPIELVDEATGATAMILAFCGMNCYSFRPVLDGKPLEVLWSHPDFEKGTERPSGSGIPLLFPFPGRLRGTSLEFRGRSFSLVPGDSLGNAIHVYVLDRPWRVIQQESARLVAQFQPSVDAAELVERWPADYRVTVTYTLDGNSLLLDTKIENPSTIDALPFGFGTHPYFRLPLGDGGNADDSTVHVPAAEHWELADMLPTGRTLTNDAAHDLRDGKPFGETKLDDVLTDLTAQDGRVTTRIVDRASGRTMTMTFDESFRECVVYNPPHREAFCIEPLTCVPNAYDLEAAGIATALRVLEPGESFTANIEIRVT